jgi:hypothetical protein
MMESSREHFEKLEKKYLDYLNLYMFFNQGSAEGATTFDDFYWRFTYEVRYEDPLAVAMGGY